MNRLLTILGVSLIAAFLVVSCAIEIASHSDHMERSR
jgi:hypothetical protein